MFTSKNQSTQLYMGTGMRRAFITPELAKDHAIQFNSIPLKKQAILSLIEKDCCMIILDTNRKLLSTCRKKLKKKEYSVDSFDLSSLDESICFNPFSYIHNEKDIAFLGNYMINFIEREHSTVYLSEFARSHAKLLLYALIAYVWKYSRDKRTFEYLLDLFKLAVHDTNKLDKLFLELQKNEKVEGTESAATYYYNEFKKVSVLPEAYVVIEKLLLLLKDSAFDDANRFLHRKEFSLKEFCGDKQALFIQFPTKDPGENLVTCMFLYLVLNNLFSVRNNELEHGTSDFRPVHLLLNKHVTHLPSDLEEYMLLGRRFNINTTIW